MSSWGQLYMEYLDKNYTVEIEVPELCKAASEYADKRFAEEQAAADPVEERDEE